MWPMWRWTLRVAFAVTALALAASQNWAQLSGFKQQNSAISSASTWRARWGHAVAVIENRQRANSETLPINQRTRVFVLGGESAVTEGVPGSTSYGGTGSYLNDVWKSQTVEWLLEASTTEANMFGDPLPRIVSRVAWVGTVPENSVPSLSQTDYEEWLCCATPAVDWGCRVIRNCDPFAKSRRWSPRRNHAAATVYASGGPYIMVLGGRAQNITARPPSNFVAGGVVGKVPDEYFRQPTNMMNDVWASVDGQTWKVQNIGCKVPTAEFTVGQGKAYQQCSSTVSCVTDLRLGSSTTVQCVNHRCVCTTWQPRERHVATVMGNSLFVTGGVTTVTKQLCATLACGEGYRVFLNDVWSSDDVGKTWQQLNSNSQWQPRADHTVTSGGGLLWLMAGRGGIANEYTNNPLFNDVWTSADGILWEQNTASAPWGPRSGAQALYGIDIQYDSRNTAYFVKQIVLIGGDEVVPASPSPSPLSIPAQAAAAALKTIDPDRKEDGLVASTGQVYAKSSYVNGEVMKTLAEVWRLTPEVVGAEWVRDFSSATNWPAYIGLDTPLSSPLLNYTAAFLSPIFERGFYTLQDLALSKGQKVIEILQNNLVPEFCYHRRRAQAIYYRCKNVPKQYDGEFIRSVKFIRGDGIANPDPPGDDPCANVVSQVVPDDAVDMPCQQVLSSRRDFRAVMFEDWPMVLGGYHDFNSYESDMWYRDGRIPITLIVNQPSSGSSDTVIRFTSDMSVAKFEYRLFKGREAIFSMQMRNWTSSRASIDYKDWLSGGTYTFQVRAISPGGNRDPNLLSRNSITWTYVPALPWLLIILGLVLIGVIIAGIFMYFRRKRRQAALEKYALKRKRRKLKAAKAGDWRNYYKKGKLDESKAKKAKAKSRSGSKKKGSKGEEGGATSRSGRDGERTGRNTERSGSKGTSRSKKGGKSSRSKSKSGKTARSSKGSGRKSARS